MIQFPCPLPPDTAEHVPTQAEQFFTCLLVVAIAASLISFFLPRPLFRKLLRVAFPFMRERLGRDDE